MKEHTFEHFDSHCNCPRPPMKLLSCSLSNLTKSTFTNDFFYRHAIPWHLPRACWWMERRIISHSMSPLFFGWAFGSYFFEIHVFCARLDKLSCIWAVLISHRHFVLTWRKKKENLSLIPYFLLNFKISYLLSLNFALIFANGFNVKSLCFS